MTQRTHLMLKVREFVFASRILDWLTWIVGALLVAGILVALNWHLMWLAFAVAAAIMATLFHFTIDPLVQRQQMDPVLQAEALLKKMRGRAVPEAALQQFVCKYAGEQWEAFYEALFGFESKLLARDKWGKSSAIGRSGIGDRGRPRPRHAAWREPVLAWIDAKQKARREAKERKLLANLEHASLKAKGYSETAAKKKAARTADTLVMKAAELREDAKSAAMETAPPPPKPEEQKKPDEKPPDQAATAEAARKRKKMLDDEGLEGFEHLSYFQRRYGGWAGLFLGPAVRFSLGAVLLTGCILWVKQNKLFNTDAIAAVKMDTAAAIEGVSGNDAANAAAAAQVSKPRKPLELRVVPPRATRYFDGWAPGVAGVILVFSAFFSAPSLGLFIVPAALVTFLGGKFGVPGIGPASSQSVATGLGLVIATVGFMFARK